MGREMKTNIKSQKKCETTVENDDESIIIWQEDGYDAEEPDLVMLFNAKMARKFIKAIRKSAEELGWEV
jgi:hypothetical protein